MELKPETQKALNAWLGPDTWDTPHSLDWQRFFDFVNQYQSEHGFTIEESGLCEIMEEKLRGKTGHPISGKTREVIRDRIRLAYYILDFLKHTGR